MGVLGTVLAGSQLVGCQAYESESEPEPMGTIVEIQETETGYQLTVDGEPYVIHGVGGVTDLELLKARGGNTIRTWDAKGIGPMMDEAHELGLKVMVGIWLEHARHGFDYSDPEQKQSEIDKVERYVREFKDHPALLAWGVGNEVEIGSSMDLAIEQINDAAAMIKSIDTNHPTMAIVAEIGGGKGIAIQENCPDIDMLGVNSYGGLGSLAARLEQQGVTLPFAVTEFGPVGHWETGSTRWGAPYEQSSSAKASFLRSNFEQTITPNIGKNCLGSFAFLWGYKQEKTSTWYGLLLESGEMTESVDVLTDVWTGKVPENRAPSVNSMDIDAPAAAIEPGQVLTLKLDASDPDGDELMTTWELVAESTVESMGGDFEDKIEAIEVPVEMIDSTSCKMTMPTASGMYRIFATVRDGKGSAGTVNAPIFIIE